ncbi:hypothetical protein AAVH_35236 [Aphelenchoides avenae]|nr:hypothetical protein AAVH_35236 [Aphelenchus avenae]
MDSVVQTLETVSAQQEQLNRALVLMSHNGALGGGALKENDVQRLHTDISIVKSLLLNQNQFPPIPSSVVGGGATHPNGTKSVPIPAWQFNGNADGSGDEHDDEPKAATDGGGSSV